MLFPPLSHNADSVVNRIITQRGPQLFSQRGHMHADGIAEAVHTPIPHMID